MYQIKLKSNKIKENVPEKNFNSVLVTCLNNQDEKIIANIFDFVNNMWNLFLLYVKKNSDPDFNKTPGGSDTSPVEVESEDSLKIPSEDAPEEVPPAEARNEDAPEDLTT